MAAPALLRSAIRLGISSRGRSARTDLHGRRLRNRKRRFRAELKTPPHFWSGPELTKRILRGDFPALSETQLREANSRGGMNLIVWESCTHKDFESDPELDRRVMEAFIQVHRGYLWKEVITTAESVERLHWNMKTGGLLWDAAADRYVDSLNGNAEEIVSKPHVVGVRLKELLERPD